MGLDEALKDLPEGCRFHVGHTPHWYRRDALPKHLRKRPFEAYVISGEIGKKRWIMVDADGATPAEALCDAIRGAKAALAEKS